MFSVAPVKPKSHQELPFWVALDDNLLCCHGTVVVPARWLGAMLPDTVIGLVFGDCGCTMIEEEKEEEDG